MPRAPKRIPIWACHEPRAIGTLVVEHSLTKLQFEALRAFASNPAGVGQPMMISFSLARALVRRDLGEIESKEKGMPHQRAHPRAQFRLNPAGQKLAVALVPQPVIEHVSTDLVKVTYPASVTLARRGIPYRD